MPAWLIPALAMAAAQGGYNWASGKFKKDPNIQFYEDMIKKQQDMISKLPQQQMAEQMSMKENIGAEARLLKSRAMTNDNLKDLDLNVAAKQAAALSGIEGKYSTLSNQYQNYLNQLIMTKKSLQEAEKNRRTQAWLDIPMMGLGVAMAGMLANKGVVAPNTVKQSPTSGYLPSPAVEPQVPIVETTPTPQPAPSTPQSTPVPENLPKADITVPEVINQGITPNYADLDPKLMFYYINWINNLRGGGNNVV